jgi:hypothetical protein
MPPRAGLFSASANPDTGHPVRTFADPCPPLRRSRIAITLNPAPPNEEAPRPYGKPRVPQREESRLATPKRLTLPICPIALLPRQGLASGSIEATDAVTEGGQLRPKPLPFQLLPRQPSTSQCTASDTEKPQARSDGLVHHNESRWRDFAE